MGKRGPKRRDWVEYKDAKEWASRLKLTNYKQWLKYVKENDIPDGIPQNPQITYGDEYVSDSDFLGTPPYLPYYQAKYFARSLNLTSYTHWLEWHKNNNPADIPRYPDATYDEWEGWGEFLGTGTVWTHRRAYRPYAEACLFVRKMKIKTADEWHKLCINQPEKIPTDIPHKPDAVYEEWTDWATWLGNTIIGKVTLPNAAKVLYIIREHGVPANVLTIGVEAGGKSAVLDAQKQKQFQIIRLYDAIESDTHNRTLFIISKHGSKWWEGSHQYAIRDVHQFLYELDNTLTRV